MSRGRAVDGDLCILLHSHMPYVEGFGTWPFGEEWLLEAMASSYVPLVGLLERRAERGAQDVVTVGVTPVLADQLEIPAVGRRFLDFMREVRRECHRVDSEGLEADGQHGAAAALRASGRDYERAADGFEAMGGDVLGALRRLRDAGTADLWTAPATHAVLPMIATGQGAALQLETGIAAHRARFGPWSGGLWLPECAYRPGCEQALGANGTRVFCIDHPAGGEALERLAPVDAGSGCVAVPIDWGTIELVWSEHGYPKGPAYRDYHRQTLNGMRAWSNGGGPYDPGSAAAQAAADAERFVAAVGGRLRRFRAEHGRRGLLVFAVDTELLGHWWYEGLQWLDHVLDAAPGAGVGLATLPEALARHDPVERRLVPSTWGEGKDMRTWDSPAVAQYAEQQRSAELRLVSALGSRKLPPQARTPAARAARELLALQSSDWAFIRTRKLAGDYPDARVSAHAANFREAMDALERAMKDFGPMPDEPPVSERSEPAAAGRLRGLAPHLRVAALAGPAGAWGRETEHRPAPLPEAEPVEAVAV